MSSELAPCPFCGEIEGLETINEATGNPNEPSVPNNISLYVVGCYKCSIQGPVGVSMSEARQLWNNRKDDIPVEKQTQ